MSEPLDAYDDAMREAGASAERFATSLTGALRDVVAEGRSFEDAMRSVALSMAESALNASLKPVEEGAANLLGRLAGGLVGAIGGGAAAPASDGLGAPGGGAPAAPVTFNVTTPDAASFRRSEGQIAAMLARSAARGRRSL